MYEIIAILNPNVTNEFVENKISDWKEIIEEYKAELQRVDRWGKKTMAYEVKKFRQGYFLLLHIDGNHDVIDELERRFRISDEVIRYQTVKMNEVEHKHSVELLDQMKAHLVETEEGKVPEEVAEETEVKTEEKTVEDAENTSEETETVPEVETEEEESVETEVEQDKN